MGGPAGHTAVPAGRLAESAREATDGVGIKVAYVMSRFPKLSETFVLNEMVALEKQGVTVELYPLLRERGDLVQDGSLPFVARAHYLPFLSWPILRSQAYWLRRRPRIYLATLRDIVRETFGSINFLVGALGIYPKVTHAARLMKADGVTHVHCHFASHPAVAGLVIHRLAAIPFSFTAHGSDLHVERRMLCVKVREAAFVAAISAYNRNLIVHDCGPEVADRVAVLRCGVDTSRFRPALLPRPIGPFSIVCVGTLHEVKGQAHLVEACRLLDAEGIAFRCTLVGDGPDRSMLEERIAAAGLNGRVQLVGSLVQDEVARVVQSADVLVAPSVPTRSGKREGIPVVLMEALACGVPAVASDLSGIPELVEHRVTGLLVPPGDANALADALRELERDPELRLRLGRVGRAKVEREFDLKTNAGLLAARFTAEAQE